MNNFTDGAPRTPIEWCDLGYYVIECNSEGVPINRIIQKYYLFNYRKPAMIHIKDSIT